MPSLTDAQLRSLETTERVASCFSLIGTIFIFITFISSPNFRKPINRLVFYASWGNILCNIATLMSESPIRMGARSHLCQFQAFLIQMFVPADALWNLAMAINVYLTLFKKYNAQQLKDLEWRYHLMCYGGTFIIAFTLIFVDTQSRGKMYGPAVLWCWISAEWDFMRIAVCYGPAWICIVISLGIYLAAGREIFAKRHQLRAFAIPTDYDLPLPFAPTSPSHIQVTRSFASVPHSPSAGAEQKQQLQQQQQQQQQQPPYPTIGAALTKGAPATLSRSSYSDNSSSALTSETNDKSYTVAITATRPSLPHKSSSSGTATRGHHRSRAALEANRAAFGYAKVAALFFVSLLVTWVPSSINRVYSLVHPDKVSVELAYVAGIVLSLMGFWNSVIYFVTSWRAVRCAWVGRWGRCDEVDEIEVGGVTGRGERVSRVGRPSWVGAAGGGDGESVVGLNLEEGRGRDGSGSRDCDSV